MKNSNNIINNNLNQWDDGIVNNSKDENKKTNLNNSDNIKENKNLDDFSELSVENDNIEFDKGLNYLYSNFNA